MRKRLWTLLPLLALLAAGSGAGAETSAKAVLVVKGMTCGCCVTEVEAQLEKTEGVTAFEVELAKGEADVTFDPSKTTAERIAASVSQTGFESSVRKAGADKGGESAGPSATASKKDCGGESRQLDRCQQPAAPEQNAEAAGLVSLAVGSSPLVADFNAAKARPRFLAILSPTCNACVHAQGAFPRALHGQARRRPTGVGYLSLLRASDRVDRSGATTLALGQADGPVPERSGRRADIGSVVERLREQAGRG